MEFMIVVTIIFILSSVIFVDYTNMLEDSRNAKRLSDISYIKIALKNHKLKNGIYPIPGNKTRVTNSGTVFYQGYLNQEVSSLDLSKRPTDPYVNGKYYLYSVTSSRKFFQVGTTMEENGEFAYAFVDGDYQQSHTLFPSILYASDSGGSIFLFTGLFIVHKGTKNLPYNEAGQFQANGRNLSDVINEPGVEIIKYCGYSSCDEIRANGAYMGSGTYCGATFTGFLVCE